MFRTTKSLQQVGALPYVWVAENVEILLITTRKRKHWVIPKGWPVKKLSLADAAAREAKQEAGVIGRIQSDAIGRYGYDKRAAGSYTVPCQVLVYPLNVTEQRLKWRERKQRARKWCALSEAADIVHESDLARLLGEIAMDPTRLPDPLRHSLSVPNGDVLHEPD